MQAEEIKLQHALSMYFATATEVNTREVESSKDNVKHLVCMMKGMSINLKQLHEKHLVRPHRMCIPISICKLSPVCVRIQSKLIYPLGGPELPPLLKASHVPIGCDCGYR